MTKLKSHRFGAVIGLTIVLPVIIWGCTQSKTAQLGKPAPTTAPAVAVAQTPSQTPAQAESQTTAPPTAAEVAAVAAPVVPVVPTDPRLGVFDADAIARIREEGMSRSQAMKTLSYLTDVIGPRLTGSPNLKRANEWTRDTLKDWGLQNAALESWGPFGRGWAMKRFSAEVIEPQGFPIIAYPKAWSPGFEQPIVADVVLMDPRSADELDAMAGKLEGKILLVGAEVPVRARFTPQGSRWSDQQLADLATGRGRAGGTPMSGTFGRGATSAPAVAPGRGGELLGANPTTAPGPATRGGQLQNNPAAAGNLTTLIINMAYRERAALICTPSSSSNDGGMLNVTSAIAAQPNAQQAGGRGGRGARAPDAWAATPPPLTPQITVSVEQYNRMVRMVRAGEKVRMAVNLQVEYNNDDLMQYNTVAEIPGTDLKDQIVMLGGHLDSWHSGTGATDNGAGVAAAMEAVRIIKALDLHPRRTIRIALWTGEEQGLYGSAQYVAKHFGTQVGGRGRGARGAPGAAPGGARGARGPTQVAMGPEYDKLSAYFNLDNGTGKIRGVFAQGNTAIMPVFKSWLAPFSDLGATTVTPTNTGSTDHVSFDNIGLPAFQFIQDEIEYTTRTHHTSQDVFDRIPADDLKQASTIMAAFVYNAAMTDGMMPRKPNYVAAPATAPADVNQPVTPPAEPGGFRDAAQ